MLLKLLNSGLHPRRMRLGLIEAQCNRALERDCPGGIRGVCASASLKPRDRHPRPPAGTRIRGVCASASLKRDLLLDDRVGLARIRGVCASASLKRARDGGQDHGAPRHPRRMRLGLIEARWCCGPTSRGSACIRGVCASASLKQIRCLFLAPEIGRHPRRMRLGLIEAPALPPRPPADRPASEAYAPRPH